MKLIASLIIAASLVLGTISASTAYVVSLDLPNEELNGLTLNARAGILFVDKRQIVNRMLGHAWTRFRQLDRFKRDVDEVIEAELRAGEDPESFSEVAPPPDAFLAQLLEREQYYEAQVYKTIIAENLRQESLTSPPRPGEPLTRADNQLIALFRPNTELDEQTLQAIDTYRAIVADTEFARDVMAVKEFSFARWKHRWWFLLACVGLFVGAMTMRASTRRALAATLQETHAAEESPFEALNRAHRDLVSLRETLSGIDDPTQQTRRIVKDIQQLQESHLAAFVQSREALIGRFGLGGYAQVMDVFASAERQVNRTWSAAADHVLIEAKECLNLAIIRMEEANQTLNKLVAALQP